MASLEGSKSEKAFWVKEEIVESRLGGLRAIARSTRARLAVACAVAMIGSTDCEVRNLDRVWERADLQE